MKKGKLIIKTSLLQNETRGYILVLSLIILSILIVVANQIFYSVTANSAFTRTVLNQQKAKMLALGGFQLAISKLILPEKEGSKEKKEESNADQENLKRFLARVLPIINQWQTFNLKENIDGVEGQINLFICSENGKINLNKMFDYSTGKFIDEGKPKGDMKKFIQQVCVKIENITGQKNLFNGLQQFLQKRKYPLNDVTELLNIPEFSYFKDYVFYSFDQKEKKKKSLYLTDIFTIWTNDFKIQPWLLSVSLATLLGLKLSDEKDINKKKQVVDQWLKNFKTDSQWVNDWDKILKPIYSKELKELPKDIDFIFDPQFDPNIFSVISYSTIGDITQSIFAIVQIQILGDNETKFKLKKLYWI